MSIEFRQSFPSPEPEITALSEHNSRVLQKKIGGNALLKSTHQIDTAVEQLHASFPLDASKDTFAKDSLILRSQLDQSEAQLGSKPRLLTDISDYFRLAGSHDFAVESAAIRAAFSAVEERDLRESIVDGLAGKSVARIEQALKIHDSTINPFKKKRLRGAISEQLTLTLVNIAENPDRIALPGSLHNDLLDKTDVNIYYFAGNRGIVAPTQVKSGSAEAIDAPAYGITIDRTMLGHYNDMFEEIDPKQDFQLARTLVKMMDGRELSGVETTIIDSSVTHFNSKLNDKLLAQPGIAI